MQFSLSTLLLIASAVTTEACLYKRATGATAPWSYFGSTGPLLWHKLDAAYSKCGTGTNQSPANLDPQISSLAAGHVQMQFPAVGDLDFFNNGHAVELEPLAAHAKRSLQARATAAYKSKIGNEDYNLLQFHFHTPSEHTLDGKQYPLEVHFVHEHPTTKKLAVVGVFFDIAAGENSHWFEKLAPQDTNSGVHVINAKDKHTEIKGLEFTSIMGSVKNNAVRNYSGSLTTPPCSEEVGWFVSEKPMRIEADQLRAFRDVIGFNSRYVQNAPGQQNLLAAGAGACRKRGHRGVYNNKDLPATY